MKDIEKLQKTRNKMKSLKIFLRKMWKHQKIEEYKN